MLKNKLGNILDSTEQYLVHQCNCVSKGASGLAAAIFRKYPYANVYKNRDFQDRPGTIKICGNGKDKRFIVNAFAQYYPGSPNTFSSVMSVPDMPDEAQARELYFYDCLEDIKKIEGLESLAIPFGIGCGLAGGNWNNYHRMIELFSQDMKNVDVVVYKLEMKDEI